MKKLWLICSCLVNFFVVQIQGQSKTGLRCGTVIDWSSIESTPGALDTIMKRERNIKNRINELRVRQQNETVYEIPVVFHIVLANPCDVTNEAIEQQLAVLNRDYGGLNTDYGNASEFEPDRAKKTNFHFSLIKQAPDGSFTNGITRTSSDLELDLNHPETYFFIKKNEGGGIDKWQATNFNCLNIWIGKFIDGVVGYSTWPVAYSKPTRPTDAPLIPDEYQGIIIDYRTIPSVSKELPEYAFGRTLGHEVGHFFNLIHIWGDDQNLANKCSYDDFVGDTPLQEVARQACSGIVFDACQPPGVSAKGIQYQNYMNYADDACTTIFTVGQADRMLQALLDNNNRNVLIAQTNKALVPSFEKEQLSTDIFNTCNSPVFTTNNFKTITVGKDGVVWAATNGQGLYQYNNSGEWKVWYANDPKNYQDMKADRDGGIWIAQNGTNGAQALSGGMLYFPNATFDGYKYYGVITNGLPSRNVRGVFVDTTRYNEPTILPLVWTANYAQITGGASATGGVGRGLNPSAPEFTSIRRGIDSTFNTGGVFSIGGDANEIWTFANNNYGKSQILRHNAQTNAFIGAYDASNIFKGILPDQFQAKAIYFDAKGNKWITIFGYGFVVINAQGLIQWPYNELPDIFPSTPFLNTNAIAGDASGNVYIGTGSGLIVYKAGDPLALQSSFKKYTTAEGLPSNNIQGICVDTLRNAILIATDNGIAFWDRSCSGYASSSGNTFSTTADGEWGTPSIWCSSTVPDASKDVIVKNAVTISSDANVKSIHIIPPGSVTVKPGVKFNILNK